MTDFYKTYASIKPNRKGCRIWPTASARNWYGKIFLGRFDGKQKFEGAHRFSFKYFNGHNSIPEGMHVLHECDNRACVQIDHLFLGSNHDNIQDKIKKGRQWQGKLTSKQRKAIAIQFAEGQSIVSLAREFRVGSGCIQTAIRRAILGAKARAKRK